MRVKDKAIVLQAIRHGDNKIILKLYTGAHGLVTAVARPGRSKSAKLRSGSLLPLTLLDAEFLMKEQREIHHLTEANPYFHHTGLQHSIVRLSIAQFMNEVLLKTLKEHHGDQHLFGFIEACLRFLYDADEEPINLHLYFLRQLSGFLGFEPHNDRSSNAPYFDMREGKFSSHALVFPLGLNMEESRDFSQFLKEDLFKATIGNSKRQTLLEILLAYYRLHVAGFNELNSLEVIREIQKA
jgi:DNA repair protein RecO (recombination protein O)